MIIMTSSLTFAENEDEKRAFSNISDLKRVFEKLRFSCRISAG